MDTEKAIILDKLSKSYGAQRVVSDLSFSVDRGEIFGFLGPNGSGKTTTIKMLCGLLKPTSGSATINGYSILTEQQRVRQSIGYMSQHFSLYKALTVEQNLNFYGELYGLAGSALRSRKDEVLAITGLTHQRDKQAQMLSGGWRQRLALACAIIHQPPIVFLDEPTAGIDPVARRTLWDLLFSLAMTGVTFFVSTHYMDEAERCGSVGYIFQSQLIALGKVDELSSMHSLDASQFRYLEVSCENVMATFQRVKHIPEIKDATIFGRTLHVVVPKNYSAERLHQELADTVEGIGEIRPIKPSLEDVFVSLTEAEQRKALLLMTSGGLQVGSRS
jgi:ABC-type multidrug transport system ATPase subunit